MWSYLTSIFHNFFNKEDEQSREEFLIEELIDLKLQSESEEYYKQNKEEETIPNLSECFQRTGVITHCGIDYVLIDGSIYFDTTTYNNVFNKNDKVLYLGYKTVDEKLNVVRILQNQGMCWENEDFEEENFNVIHHIMVGQVKYRQGRFVYIEGGKLKFNLDNVEGNFIPIEGDWLEMKCAVQRFNEKLTDISMTQVLEVITFCPLRTKIKSGTVSDWFGEDGIIDKDIYFNSSTLVDPIMLQIGTKVMVEAIESTKGKYAWRAIKLSIIKNKTPVPNYSSNTNNDEKKSLELEKIYNISMTYPLKFDGVDIYNTESLNFIITNNSNQVYLLHKWIMLSTKRDSQVKIKPFINQPKQLGPEESICFTITCEPKFLGSTKECLVIQFKGFQLKRYIEINIIGKLSSLNGDSENSHQIKYLQPCYKIKKPQKQEGFIPGVNVHKKPHFTYGRIGMYLVPDKIWSVIIGDSEKTIYSNDYGKIVKRIETCLPCLVEDLTMQNYCDRWHTLLYMDEVQATIDLRAYDIPKAFLVRHHEYLGLEISGLREKRPSLIVGDRVLVKDNWNDNNRRYEGFIHIIKASMVLCKFHSKFHDVYDGGDVSVQFFLNTSSYRRAHHAINKVVDNVGPEVLFPAKLNLKPPQVSNDQLVNLKWYNGELNNIQKRAIINILKGESRPLPYIIFGPPGTGKTMTVVETILQILKNIPHSRILVAAPSNSASNLITERLIQYRNDFSGSVVRLLANYLIESENISDVIKPYCATIDIAKEGSSEPNNCIKDNMNINCQKSQIGRHRVTISTCNSIGSLYYLGFPKGHFTHVIIDEAGQATEPETMIPLSFSDSSSVQTVLAGDPMQLGPVVSSKYCLEFGMDNSYLCRLLESYPYQKDFNSFKDGFDDRLVTKLIDNYRSLEEILSLPSTIFYNSALVPKFDRNTSWIPRLVDATCNVFDITENKSGGIYVFGIQGQNVRAEDNPSWYNPQEASMVALTTCKLYKNSVTPEEIGIISPYIAQIKYLRLIFDAMGLPKPKIGTVEEFQGQERPIILITTVRSTASLIQEDTKHTLGFVKNPKRINVAITRAQVSLILFCNPQLLCLDPIWKEVIINAVKNNKYMGCYFPVFD